MFKNIKKKDLNLFLIGSPEEAYTFINIFQEISQRLKINIVGVVSLGGKDNFLKKIVQRGIKIFTEKDLPPEKNIDLVIDLAGTKKTLEIAKSIGSAIVNPLGAYIFYNIIEDLRDKIRLERQFCYNERMSMISALAHSLADTIRNPVTAIGGFAKSILETKSQDYDTFVKKAQIILEEAEKLERVLKEIYQLGKPYVLRKEVGNINELIEEICRKFSPTFAEKGITVIKKLEEEEEELYTLIDTELFKRGIESIFRAIVETIQRSSILTITTEVCLDAILITIIIAGKGMTKWEFGTPLQPLFPWENKIAAYLNMARKVIEDHGGKFIIYSEPNIGNKILIELPIELPSKPPV